METKDAAVEARDRRPQALRRLRSWIRYGIGLRAKLVVLVLAIALLVVGALYGFSFMSLRTSIAAIYEQRARSVAAVISKSIEEKEYILYYSDEFDADISRLLERYESVVGITVVGLSGRGFLSVASTDPTQVGALATEEEQDRFETLEGIEVCTVRLGGVAHLRAYHPLFSGADLLGVVVVDMSLAEQAHFISQLSWQFGVAAVVGFVALGGLLYFVLWLIVTKPVGRLAEAIGSVAERKYDVEVSVPSRRIPGTPLRDEVGQLIDGFNLMTKVIHSHEQELMKLVVLDELTGAYTLDHLRAELDRELSKTRRYGHATSTLVIRLDGLASRTEEERDHVLVRTASFLVGNLRNVDILFRVGDLRFAVMLPETPPAGAAVAAERLRGLVPDVTAQFDFPFDVSIDHIGWEGDDAPAIDEAIGRIIEPSGDVRE